MSAVLLCGVPLRRVTVLHAHPDDETLASGILLATLAQSGVAITLITATRGERGEVVPGPLSALVGTPGLRRERERELARALAALGVQEHRFLGDRRGHEYQDSGMSWGEDGRAQPAPDVGPEAFTRADEAVAIADLVAELAESAPDALISYDSDGGYGHPDHLRAHEIAVAAARQSGVPLIVIDHQEPGESLGDHRATLERGPVDARVRAALEAHATQLSLVGDTITHSGGQEEPIAEVERVRLYSPDTP